MPRALIAMSGGVDSSVAALLMQRQGYDCIGCTMRLFDNEAAGLARGHTCCSLEDVEDARSVAFRLGIPYYAFNFKDEFRACVMEKFARSYENGLTPNPCIDCNRYLKFGRLYQRARELGCDCVVTGHYARIARDGERYRLKTAADSGKDQSYVLYFLTQGQLAHTRFPLGELPKEEVRRLAVENGLVTAAKPDSQDICFAPDGDYAGAIERITGREGVPGDFVDEGGTVLGRHRGIVRYTLGQRRGLGVSAPDRLYVCGISPRENTVTLGGEMDLFRDQTDVTDCHWVSGEAPAGPVRCQVKTRYRQRAQSATVIPDGERRSHILFDRPQRAVTPGQAAVLYDGDTVLGGGTLVYPAKTPAASPGGASQRYTPAHESNRRLKDGGTDPFQ